jgi:5-methylthioadenosine/S-adenosylhomocysteine deaminase
MQNGSYWIINAKYLNPKSELCFGHILVKDGFIAEISQDLPKLFDSSFFIDANKLIIIPGLINSHTHLPMVMFRGLGDSYPLHQWLNDIIFPLEAQWTSEDIYVSSMMAIAECIHSGCTCVADMYFFIEEIAQAVNDSGIRAALSLGLVQSNGDKGLAESQRIFHKLHGSSHGRISIHIAPHAIYTCPPSFLKEVIALTKSLNTKLHIHINETQKEVWEHEKEYKKHPIETMAEIGMFDLSVLAAHCVYLNPNEINILKQAKDVLVVHNPSSNMKLASGIAPISSYKHLNIPTAIGTDGAASNNNLNMFFELRLACLLSKVSSLDATLMSAKEALEMATIIPGKFLGPSHLGSIEELAPADFIMLDVNQAHCLPTHNILSNIVFAMNGSEVDTMIVNGQILMQNKHINTFNEDKIKEQFIALSKKYQFSR